LIDHGDVDLLVEVHSPYLEEETMRFSPAAPLRSGHRAERQMARAASGTPPA